MSRTLDDLKRRVCDANLALVGEGLVIQTWGNVSGADRQLGAMVIKPSGVAYDGMRPEHMVAVSLESGRPLDSDLRPSSDTATHLELYRAFEKIAGVVHTHSTFATAWAQGCRSLPALGTTHADYFHGPVPCTRPLTEQEVGGEYEANTGRVIVETFEGIDPLAVPAVLVGQHGPFTWGASPEKAVASAILLEHLCLLASQTLRVNPDVQGIPRHLLDKHYLRKHGPGAYYGQK
ncbi:MAG: L-ribulose-5-phosphate 4-epimerase AraD [Phycisphaerae bacterium]